MPGWAPALLVILVPIAGLVAVNYLSLQIGWILTFILMLAFCIVAGQLVSTRWTSVLIEERNVMSLPRLQMSLWMIVVLSAR